MTADRDTGEIHRLLADLHERVPVESIEKLWLFPPRRLGDRETGLAVLSLLPPDEPKGPRRVLTLRYEVRHAAKGDARSHELTDQGTAPADSVRRVIDGVLRRLGDDAQDPTEHTISGDPARWAGLLDSLRPAAVDPDGGE